MAYRFQVTIDSSDPHAQADWWATTLGWEVEPSDPDQIRSLVAQGLVRDEDTLVHDGTLVWADGAAIRDPAGGDDVPRVLFVRVPEPKTVKNRMHLDVRVGDDDPDEVRAALEARGARFVHVGHEGPSSWITMVDPEGNEFCLT